MPSLLKLGIIFISIWCLFIWDTLEIKYQMMHSEETWFNSLELNLFSCPNIHSKNLTNFKCRVDKNWAQFLIQFDVFLFGIHWRSSTKWCTRGANDLTGSRWTCLVVQMSTPSIWRISNSVVSHHFFQSVLGSEELLRTLAWICRVPPKSCFNALQATSYDIELKWKLRFYWCQIVRQKFQKFLAQNSFTKKYVGCHNVGQSNQPTRM